MITTSTESFEGMNDIGHCAQMEAVVDQNRNVEYSIEGING